MKILVTAGSTQMPIDNVRVISNIFKGRTGTNIAWTAAKNHEVTLIANPISLDSLNKAPLIDRRERELRLIKYKTFDELETVMKEEITTGNYDVIIHSAAVSDYRPVDVMVSAQYFADGAFGNSLESVKKAKVSSEHSEIYIKCVQTPKLIDYIRKPWGFTGTLVKFKLQVGITKEELLEIAKKSRTFSNANFIVANLLDDFNQPSKNMYICGDGVMKEVTRSDLPLELLNLIERGD